MTPTQPASPATRLAGVLLLLAALAVVVAGCWLLYRVEAGRVIEELGQRETVRVNLLSELLKSELRPVTSDVRLLAEAEGLRAYLDGGSPNALPATILRAQTLSNGHPEYDQVRLLDEHGREIIRINQGGRIVPGGQLQDKSDRDYFLRTMTLPPGGLYVSAVDLNVENGAVEIPFKPMLRFAMPVFDSSGRHRGVYVINYLISRAISDLQQASGADGHRLRLLNAGGFWIKAADDAQEWGAVLPERASSTLAHSNPGLWARLQREAAGQSIDASHSFTWRRVLPADMVGAGAAPPLAAEPYLVVAAEVLPAELTALTAGVRKFISVGAPVLVLLTLLCAWLLRARRKVLVELRTANQLLEERVRQRTLELARSYEELSHREALLEETGQLAKVGGWEFDPATGEGTWTPEVARIHDLGGTVKLSRELGLQFFPGESRARIEAALNKSLADGSPYDLELEFISAGGTHKWVHTISRPVMQDGRVVRMRGALQDITERKQIEMRMQAQLQRMNMLERITRAIGERQDLSSILQVVVRSVEEQLPLDFGCICVYDAAARMLTVTAVGVGSMALAEQLAMGEQAHIPIDENGLSRCVRGQLVYEADIAAADFPFPRRLAAVGLRSLVAAPLQIESQVFGVLIAARRTPQAFSSSDCEFLRQLSEHVALASHQAQLLTALQTAYEDLRNTQQAVMQHERLRVLGQMASGIAHDINNAISPIMLYTDSLLEREKGLSETAQQSLRTIQQAVSDVAETVARMREFYRQRDTASELQPMQLNAVIMQVRDLTRARWETMPQQQGIVIDLQLDLAEHLPPVQGIESEIREALINLVFNAVDAMPAGGRLTVRSRPGTAGNVIVEVVDTGGGMDEETRRRCLEPFYTTKGERGTGLGLAMVYGVMQRHGGEIDIDSAVGAGTTVRLSFAVADMPVAAAAPRPTAIPTNLAILLVDDDPILLRSLREILEIDGHHITATDGGQAGINAFRASLQPDARPFSIVITDLGMPHVDGRAVAAAVKQAAPQTPVILLTGWGERLLSEGHSIPHVDRVLSKPPRLRDVRKALAELARAAGP